MATKRKKRRPTKRRALAAAPRHKTAITKARRKRRKRGLADAFTKGGMMAAGGTMLKGAAGGFVTKITEKGLTKLLPSAGKFAAPIAVIGLSYVAHAMLKQPDVSAGMTGALAYSLASNIPGLNEADFADDDALYDDAPYMDEYGNPLNEDGDYLEEDDDYLDDGDLAGYYDQGYADY